VNRGWPWFVISQASKARFVSPSASIGVDKDRTPGLALIDENRVSRDGLDVDEESKPG